MKAMNIYVTHDEVVKVVPHYVERIKPTVDADKVPEEELTEDDVQNELAYFTIYAGKSGNYIHINQQYLQELIQMLMELQGEKVKEIE